MKFYWTLLKKKGDCFVVPGGLLAMTGGNVIASVSEAIPLHDALSF